MDYDYEFFCLAAAAAGNPEPHLYLLKSVLQAGCTAVCFQDLNETVFTNIYEQCFEDCEKV